MQRCSEFQFQSKILNKIVFAIVFTIIILFPMNSQVFGQSNEQIDISKYYDSEGEKFDADFGQVLETDKLIFEIGKNENVHVKHVITGSAWGSDTPKLIKMLPGKHSNLEVTDEDGDYLRPMGFVGETFEESEYIIAGQKAFRGYDLVAEYDLEDFLELSEYGMWSKHFEFNHDVLIYIDEGIDLVFHNSRPVDISDANGINCIGCNLHLEFFDKSDTIRKVITKDENKMEEFVVEFLSDGKIDDVSFTEELSYLSFDINRENQLYVLKIPLDLLLSPYQVYLTETGVDIFDQSDKIRKMEYQQTDTHANVSFRAFTNNAPSEGTIHVVGATEMEHVKQLEVLEKRELQSASETKEDVKENVVKENVVKEDTTEEFYKDWESIDTNTNNDNTISFVIIGILAVIVVGIIIKLKKN